MARNKFTKLQLERLLQEKDYLTIAQDFGIADKTILFHLKKFGVDRNLYYLRRHHTNLHFNNKFFTSLNNEKSAYWFGFILADGYVQGSPRNRLSIELGIKDKNHLIKFAKDIELDINKIKYISSNNTNRIQIYSYSMYQDLVAHGCRQKKSLNMQWPKIKDQYMNHMIRGYFDGDGHVGKYSKKYSLSICGSLSFLQGLCEYLNLHTTIAKQGKIYKLLASNLHYIEFFYHYLYHNASVYLDRKHNKFKEILGV